MAYDDFPTEGTPGIAAALRLSVVRFTRRLRAERDPANELSVGQLMVLARLYFEGGGTVGELAAEERVKPPAMTRTIDALEKGGFVTRRTHETDGRQVVVTITPRGEKTHLDDTRRRDAWLAERLDALPARERDVLREAAVLLRRLATD